MCTWWWWTANCIHSTTVGSILCFGFLVGTIDVYMQEANKQRRSKIILFFFCLLVLR